MNIYIALFFEITQSDLDRMLYCAVYSILELIIIVIVNKRISYHNKSSQVDVVASYYHNGVSLW